MAAVYTCLTRRVLQVDYGFSVNMSYHAIAAPMVSVYTCLTTHLSQVDYGCSVYLSDDTCVAGGLWLQCIPV